MQRKLWPFASSSVPSTNACHRWVAIACVSCVLSCVCCVMYLMRWVWRRPAEPSRHAVLPRHEGLALGQPCLGAVVYRTPAPLLQAVVASTRQQSADAPQTEEAQTGNTTVLGVAATGPAPGYAVRLHAQPHQSPVRMPRLLFGVEITAPPVLPDINPGAPRGLGVAARGAVYDVFGPRQQRGQATAPGARHGSQPPSRE